MEEELKKTVNTKVFSITVVIIGLIGSIITIYAFFVQSNKPNLGCEIVAESNVFDINADISDLEIIYKEKNLKQTEKILKLLQVKFVNNGTGDILINQFDPSYPVTLNLINGEMLEKPEVIKTSNDYLTSIIKVIGINNSIVFPSFILDKNQYFIIKILVLCDNSKNLDLSISGKIAGQKEINISNKIINNDNQSFLANVFKGNVLIQFVRAFSYTIITVFLGILIGILVSKILDFISLFQRKKDIKNFLKKTKTIDTKINQMIFSYYIDGNFSSLKSINKILSDEKDINDYYKKLNKLKKKDPSVGNKDGFQREIRYMSHFEEDFCTEMVSIGLVINDRSVYRINEDLHIMLVNFVEYIKTHNKKEYGKNEYFIANQEENKLTTSSS